MRNLLGFLGLTGLIVVIFVALRLIPDDGTATTSPRPSMLMAAVTQNKVDERAGLQTQKELMDFVQCKEEVVKVSSATGMAFTTVVDNAVFYMVRFGLDGGSILATCSAPDGAMAVTSSPAN